MVPDMRGRLDTCSAILLLIASTLVILISAQYSDPAEPTRQYYRPLIGGIQIYSGYYCTIGYIARDASGNVGILTAGHCVDYSYYEPVYQPEYSTSYYIGKPSRISVAVDAAFVPFSSSAPYILHINNFYGTYYPSKWNVYDYVPFEYVQYFTDVPVYKTGRTTGTTSGYIKSWRGWQSTLMCMLPQATVALLFIPFHRMVMELCCSGMRYQSPPSVALQLLYQFQGHLAQ